MKFRRLLSIALALVCCLMMTAQTSGLRIHYKDGSRQDVSLQQVDSITFVTAADSVTPQPATIIGSWLWGRSEAGYYELITFSDDYSYTGYDMYFEFGYDSNSYGVYSLLGNMLTLRSYGWGYQRLYRWFVTTLSENALEVMTQMGSFVYYRLQPEVIRLQAGGQPYVPAEGDTPVFADGVMVRIADGQLYGILAGTSYVQLRSAKDGLVRSYKVIVG